MIGALVYFSGVAVWLSRDYEIPNAKIGWALIVGIIGKNCLKVFFLEFMFRDLHEHGRWAALSPESLVV